MRNTAYWNEYYRERRSGKIPLPSQFAAFIAGEFSQRADTVVDLGCGNGRDSLFFARHGFRVIGVDDSSEATQLCAESAKGLDAQFLCSDIADPSLGPRLAEAAKASDSILVYARFFLHAIDDAAEAALLRLVAGLCGPGCFLALEFRTMRDREQAKVTAAHYRRFINPLHFLTRSLSHGLALDYFAEGFGYAKYRNDDAHVARAILKKT